MAQSIERLRLRKMAFEQGRDDHSCYSSNSTDFSRKEKRINPYPSLSLEHEEWINGWDYQDQLMLDEEERDRGATGVLGD